MCGEQCHSAGLERRLKGNWAVRWKSKGAVITIANVYCLAGVRNVHGLPSSSPQPRESPSQPILATRKLRLRRTKLLVQVAELGSDPDLPMAKPVSGGVGWNPGLGEAAGRALREKGVDVGCISGWVALPRCV